MGVAGLSVAIFLLFSFGVSWISGDKERGALEEQVKDEQGTQKDLEKQLKDAQVKSAGDAQLLRELERKLNEEIGEKKRLERALAIEERQNRIAAAEGGDAGAEGGDAGVKGSDAGVKGSNVDQRTLTDLDAKNKQDIAMLEAKLKAAEDAKKQAEQTARELEDFRTRYEDLSKKYNEKGAAAAVVSLDELARRNKELEEKLKESEQARASLETKLSNYDKAVNVARASLRNDKLVLDDERLNAKLKDIQLAMDNARMSGLIKDTPAAASLAASVKEAELLLEQARARRAEAEALLNQSADMDTAQLLKQLSGMYAAAKKEKEEAFMTVGLLQTAAKERSKGQVSNLEARLMSLERNRTGIEGQLTEAMSAIVSLDETAARLETGLQSGAQPMEGMLKLQAEIETLRQAREKVRLAMENVKGSMENSMDSETLRMKGEINQISGSLEKIALINKAGGAGSLMGQVGLEEEPMGVTGSDTLILNKKLQGLNLAIDDVFKEAPAQPSQAASGAQQTGTTAPCGEASEDKQIYDSYVIQKGDSLWKIAAKKKIYGNPYLWPLLYKYNLQTVYNPDLIYPNFTLKIKRNLDKPEIALATRKANKHTRDKRRKGYIKRLRNELTSGIEQR